MLIRFSGICLTVVAPGIGARCLVEEPTRTTGMLGSGRAVTRKGQARVIQNAPALLSGGNRHRSRKPIFNDCVRSLWRRGSGRFGGTWMHGLLQFGRRLRSRQYSEPELDRKDCRPAGDRSRAGNEFRSVSSNAVPPGISLPSPAVAPASPPQPQGHLHLTREALRSRPTTSRFSPGWRALWQSSGDCPAAWRRPSP